MALHKEAVFVASRLVRATTRRGAPMNRSHRAVRASFYLALTLPLVALACGQAFTNGSGDGGEGEGGIVFGDGGGSHDGTVKDGGEDAGADARHDGPEQSDAKHDGPGMPDGGIGNDGAVETGGGCPSGSLMCSDGGCAVEGPTNCGTCGNDCTMLPHVVGASCTNGECSGFTCAQGWAHCTTNPSDGCETNITTSPNCAGCGVTCSPMTPVCSSTGCVSGCMSGQTLCNGTTCVNTTNDPQNCNGCNMVCPAGPAHSQPTCANSVCGWSCDPTYSQCGSSCVDETTDTNNCGMCSHVCPAGPPNSTVSCSGGNCGWSCDVDYEQCGSSCARSVPVTGSYFVAPGGPTTGCGIASAPCGTISAVLSLPKMNATQDVYVAQGTYAEQVAVPAGVAIHGGWVYLGGGQWTYPCAQDPSKTVIQAPAGADRVVTFSYASGTSSLDTLTIANGNTASAGNATTSGESLYGIFASPAIGTSGQFLFTNGIITVNPGGAGGTGAQGAPGGAPLSSCAPSDGADAGAGGVGSAASNGSYSVNGFYPAGGGTGSQGGQGDDGKPAPAAPCVDTYSGTYTTNVNCCNITNVGCGACTGSLNNQICSSQGTNGCGTPGGLGGAGGTGGGASIGAFVYSFTGTFQGVTITTGAGGQGGNGGAGGAGQPGSAGASGAQSSQGYFNTCNTKNCPSNCICGPGPLQYVPGGGPGGTGGTGGTGGQGGGGAGGDSYCYVASTATVNGSVTCNAGPGGAGGNNNAATGKSGTHP